MWMFRLPPVVYLGLAPLGLILAIYLFFADRQSEADKAAARAGKPPALVTLQQYAAAPRPGLANEVNVAAQVDVSRMMEVTRSEKGTVSDRWMIAPIYPTNAANASGPAIGLMVQKGPISDAQLARMVVAEGAFGPIVRINGRSMNDSEDRQAIAETSQRIPLAPNPIYIDPFEAGREAGLAPSSDGRNLALAALVAALLVGAFGAFRFFSERNTDRL